MRNVSAHMTVAVILALVVYAALGVFPPQSPAPRDGAVLETILERGIVTDEDAYRFLSSLPATWAGTSRRDCGTYSPEHIRKLQSAFALQVAKMALAWQREKKSPLIVMSAYRSHDEQRCSCEGETGLCKGWKQVQRIETNGTKKRRVTELVSTGEISHHELGRAIDLRPGRGTRQEYRELKTFLDTHPEFGLHQPYWPSDRPHIESKGVAPSLPQGK